MFAAPTRELIAPANAESRVIERLGNKEKSFSTPNKCAGAQAKKAIQGSNLEQQRAGHGLDSRILPGEVLKTSKARGPLLPRPKGLLGAEPPLNREGNGNRFPGFR